MLGSLPAIFSLIVAAAGWFYMFYSRAAFKLVVVEAAPVNHLRVRLRRIGGAAMILLACAFYAGYVAIDRGRATAAAGFLVCVLALMFAVIVLGLIDLRLTNELRRQQRRQDQE